MGPTADHEWWIRHGDLTRNVEDMRADETSTLWFTSGSSSCGARARLRSGPYASVEGDQDVWAWRRGDGYLVAVNLSDRPRAVRGVQGAIRLDTGLARIGEQATGTLRLAPWEGAVVGN